MCSSARDPFSKFKPRRWARCVSTCVQFNIWEVKAEESWVWGLSRWHSKILFQNNREFVLPSYDFIAQVLITGIQPSTHWLWLSAPAWIYMAIQKSTQPGKSHSYLLSYFIVTKISSLYFMWLLLKHNECTRLQSLYMYINRSVPLQS